MIRTLFLRYLLVMFFLVVAVLVVNNPVFANPPTFNLKEYGCLGAVLCNDVDAEHSKNINCPATASDEHDVYPHRTRIFNTAPMDPNAEIYVTECIDTAQHGRVCTTGSHRLDKKLFCGDENATDPNCDHYALLAQQTHGYILYPDRNWIGYTVYYTDFVGYSTADQAKAARVDLVRTASEGERRPVRTDANGRLPIVEWQALTYPETTRTYSAFQIVPVVPTTPTPTTDAPGLGGQQQATLSFEPYVASQNCQSVRFDPYGRVFDAISLEPIPQASVSLFQKNPTTNEFTLEYAQARNIISLNPQNTYVNGDFSYLVEDGDYLLRTAANGYVLNPRETTPLGKNTNRIYSDLFFADSPPILQRGAIQHRDIPLTPVDGIGKSYELKIISQHQESELLNGKQVIRFSGEVSHPYAKADVYVCNLSQTQTETCNLLRSYFSNDGGPDQFGSFSFVIDQTEITEGGRFRVEFVKQNLPESIVTQAFGWGEIFQKVQSIFGVSPVIAQESNTASILIEPLPAYIEGYAYDESGRVLSNTTVNILLPLSRTPVFTTTTNASGLYRITSEFLPQSPYTISYVQDQTESTVSPSRFLAQNQEFTIAEEIDPVTPVTQTSNPRRDVVPQYVPEATTYQPSPEPVESGPEPASTQAQNPLLLVGGVILLLIGAAGVLLAVYVYKKRASEEM